MEKTSFYDQMERNKRDSILLILVVFVFLIALIFTIGLLYSPESSFFFLTIALIITLIHIFVSYNYGDSIVLRSVNARPADERKEIYLINTVEGLAIAAGLSAPKVYVIDSPEMNAFATGKDPQHASIAVTSGLLQKLNRSELEGVIGHEMSHIRNYDIRFATLVAVLIGLVAIISNIFVRSMWLGGGNRDERKGGGIVILLVIVGILLAVLAPVFTRLAQAMISRRREYLADASSAELTRNPEGLASALEKIRNVNTGKMQVSEAVSHLFFVDPTKSALDSLFATHPPIEKRIKVLRSM
ncbi:MAG: M48 family metalloprotease [Candidatus Micrarchaeota archaeon]|nr:M48 family metalloprotease [Candidatus Micrarchaeota archaeon]